jgi:carboxypeptidase Q
MPALIAALAAVLLLADNWLEPYRAPAAGIIHAATQDDRAWRQLAFMTDTFGPRLSGTPALDAALRWAAGEMKQDFDEVRLDPVTVPRWVRGTESLEIVAPFPAPLVMLGLGNSVGTSGAPLEAELLVVRSFAELDASGAKANGRIVLFNVPYTGYGETVRYRAEGPSRAAARGAVAALVRSVGLPGLRTPHTGALQYTDADPRVPAAAIPAEDADRLQRMQDRGARVVLRLRMDATFLPDAESANLVAEYRGRELPDEIVAIGCHIDSWDVGTGATDDGGGCIAMWEAVRVLKTLGLRPRRTIRVVFWTNEENGLRGGLAYRDRYRAQLGKHVMMMESDSGVFRPIGFRFTGPERGRALLAAIATLLAPIDATRIGPNGGGADIGPSVEAGGIPAMSLDVDGSRYFVVHHTAADTVDKIDPADLSKCVAAVAVMSYVVADMPGTLR